MVGERGPEMFVPNAGGRIVSNEKTCAGSTNVVVNVDASGSGVEGDEQDGRELGRLISVAVQSEILQQTKTRRITCIMATFPSIKPTYGQQKRSAPFTRTIRFADGYEHRILIWISTTSESKSF